MAEGTLFNLKNFNNPFARRKRVEAADFVIDGVFRDDLYQDALREEAAEDAKRDQLSSALASLGKTDGGGGATVGRARPGMTPVTASPFGFPMDINLAGGNVMPGASTQPFGSMEQLMARANLLEQAKRKRVF
jgi:hypothetical protein